MNEIIKLKYDLAGLTIKNILFQPSIVAIINYRFAAFLWNNSHFLYLLYMPIWRIISNLTGIEIYGKTKIGRGLKIVHYGQIFIHPKVVIGRNCRIFNSVSIGSSSYFEGKVPIIGDNVSIGVGAKILGNITIGDNCKIGANAVVIRSAPKGSTLVGIPAKILKS